jgi:hypothetical protein
VGFVWQDLASPSGLLEQVRSTAPFLDLRPEPAGRLTERAAGPLGWLAVLRAAPAWMEMPLDEPSQWEDYFTLCLACHHATVATFVPTDVDTKIRGILWRKAGRESLEPMFASALAMAGWSIAGISTRATELAGAGPVSGHNGEVLSVLLGALGSFLRAGDLVNAERAKAAVDAELQREAAEFRFALRTPGCELDVLRLASTLTHNAGDVDQGISFWPKGPAFGVRTRFERLAHENTQPYGGAFAMAARIYKAVMSVEGHRNYPLRAAKGLRRSAELLLPLSPFLDDWGSTVARHPQLTDEDRAEVLAALVTGSRKLQGQRGYQRAIHGMMQSGGRFEGWVKAMPSTARADWKDAGLRKEAGVARGSFESMMKKMLAAAT